MSQQRFGRTGKELAPCRFDTNPKPRGETPRGEAPREETPREETVGRKPSGTTTNRRNVQMDAGDKSRWDDGARISIG